MSSVEKAAVEVLVEEIEARTNLRLKTASEWPESSVPVILVGTTPSIREHYGEFEAHVVSTDENDEPEGFTITYFDDARMAPTVLIEGNDTRGMLFGVGYFLRKAYMYPQKLLVPDDLSESTSPRIPLRGHQLGYRPKTNSYDGLTEEMWEQYIRDLIVFGTNAIELLPPNTDDAADSPMFPRPPLDMMVRMSHMAAKYGMDVWVWYPLMYGDYSEAENVRKSLEENELIFSTVPKVDAIFIPGGDPGHTQPTILFNYLKKQAEVLHKYHPNAGYWVSPQGFDGEWMEEFLHLVREEPAWLSGIVYGPQVRLDVDQLRAVIPDKYPIRRYPDITHNFDSQYPVPDWDLAYAATEHRESINPRPRQQKAIFNTYQPDAYHGFITYSEGVNDDVNKIIWSGLGWDPDADVMEILRDYSRYFIGPEYEYDFTQAILDLEHNWSGSLLENTSVYTTHHKFQAMEDRALPRVRLNWRFQQPLFRSYYDAYTRSRLLYETQLEDEAMNILRRAPELGSIMAMDQAEDVLERAVLHRPAAEWRERLFELADALFQSIRMQKTVDRHFAIGVRRGANLALVDNPLNNRIWLKEQFDRIRELDLADEEGSSGGRLSSAFRPQIMEDQREEARLEEIEQIVNWGNPGPGGYYDDLGDLSHSSRVIGGGDYAEDPAFLSSPFAGFTIGDRTKHWRTSWVRYMQTLYDQPLTMHYAGLDPNAKYEVKVTYTGNSFDRKVQLLADGGVEVHPYLEKPLPVRPVSFDVPQAATQDGELTLMWNAEPGAGGTGRGTQVAEVWLLKKQDKTVE